MNSCNGCVLVVDMPIFVAVLISFGTSPSGIVVSGWGPRHCGVGCVGDAGHRELLHERAGGKCHDWLGVFCCISLPSAGSGFLCVDGMVFG